MRSSISSSTTSTICDVLVPRESGYRQGSEQCGAVRAKMRKVLPRSSVIWLTLQRAAQDSCKQSSCWHSSFFRQRGSISAILRRQSASEACAPERTFRSLCAVPARNDTEPERLFCFDVTRREILQEVCFQESVRSSIERWVTLRLFGEQRSFRYRWRVGQSRQLPP